MKYVDCISHVPQSLMVTKMREHESVYMKISLSDGRHESEKWEDFGSVIF
jgi:hypothetical protein